MKTLEMAMERIIFFSRWVQVPIYVGLIFASALYCYKFTLELIHLYQEVSTMSEEVLMLGILTLVDIAMVVNLLTMVIIGGYVTFVSKIQFHDHEDKPNWLDQMDSSSMKVKLAGSLVAISGIHLLKAFVKIGEKDLEIVRAQLIIHAIFVVSTLLLAWTAKILHESHS